MNLKIYTNHVIIILFTTYFFLWEYIPAEFFGGLVENEQFNFFVYKHGSIKFRPSYLILILLIPILYNQTKKYSFSIKEIFNNQKKILYFTTFVIIHFFLIKFIYDDNISTSEIANILYLIILSIIYCNYRNFIFENFNKILLISLIIFVFFSFNIYNKVILYGQCQNDLFLINLINDYLKINLTNSIYLENSHMAIMMVPVLFSTLTVLKENISYKVIFSILFILLLIILFNNLSTTFFVIFFVSQIFLLIFFFKKFNNNFWIVTILIFMTNLFIFTSDKNCTKKISDFSPQGVLNNSLDKPHYNNEPESKNMTTLIYERSIIIALETLKNRPLGWGIDGMDNATHNLVNRPEYDKAHVLVKQLNFKDGLSNSLKMITEFGILSIIILYFFFKYIFNIKKINSYNIFIIILFVAMCVRGVGYFSGGFIFCLFEFIYLNQKFLIKKISK